MDINLILDKPYVWEGVDGSGYFTYPITSDGTYNFQVQGTAVPPDNQGQNSAQILPSDYFIEAGSSNLGPIYQSSPFGANQSSFQVRKSLELLAGDTFIFFIDGTPGLNKFKTTITFGTGL